VRWIKLGLILRLWFSHVTGLKLLLQLGAALTGNHDVLESRLVSISQVGHCSGWATLAGAVMVFRVLARTYRSMMAAGRDAS
jgi:hypothetical protein